MYIYGTYLVGCSISQNALVGFFCSISSATKKPDGRFYKFVNNYCLILVLIFHFFFKIRFRSLQFFEKLKKKKKNPIPSVLPVLRPFVHSGSFKKPQSFDNFHERRDKKKNE
jgi:hypothetical protein